MTLNVLTFSMQINQEMENFWNAYKKLLTTVIFREWDGELVVWGVDFHFSFMPVSTTRIFFKFFIFN